MSACSATTGEGGCWAGFPVAVRCEVRSASSYGGLSQPLLYPVLRKLADGYSDEQGQMTAISSALSIQMVQVFIQHGDAQTLTAARGDGRTAKH